jgi:hypothetical protein
MCGVISCTQSSIARVVRCCHSLCAVRSCNWTQPTPPCCREEKVRHDVHSTALLWLFCQLASCLHSRSAVCCCKWRMQPPRICCSEYILVTLGMTSALLVLLTCAYALLNAADVDVYLPLQVQVGSLGPSAAQRSAPAYLPTHATNATLCQAVQQPQTLAGHAFAPRM